MNKSILFLLVILFSFNCFSLSLDCVNCNDYELIYGSKHTLEFQLNESTNFVNNADCKAITKIGDKTVSIYEGKTSAGLFLLDIDSNEWIYNYGYNDYMSQNVTTEAFCECFNGTCTYQDGTLSNTYNYSTTTVTFEPKEDKFRFDIDYFQIFFALFLVAGIFAWTYSKMDIKEHSLYKIVLIFLNKGIVFLTFFLISSLLHIQTKLGMFEKLGDIFMYLFYFLCIWTSFYWFYYGVKWILNKYYGDDDED